MVLEIEDKRRQLSNNKTILKCLKDAHKSKQTTIEIIPPYQILNNDRLPIQIKVDKEKCYVCYEIYPGRRLIKYKLTAIKKSVPAPRFIH
jgi:hypothetical protein